MGGVVAAVAVVAIVAAVLVVALTRESKPSDEERIRQFFASAQNAWNNSDFDAFADLTCDKDRQGEDFTESNFRDARVDEGRVEITVKSVEVSGDTAIASVEEKYETEDEPDSVEHDLVREGGEWKVCSTD